MSERIQHEWGCAAWSSGDDSECDEICGATSRAKGNGGGKPSASTPSPTSQPDRLAAFRALAEKLKRRARVDCDPANGSAITQAKGQAEGEIADLLTALIAQEEGSNRAEAEKGVK